MLYPTELRTAAPRTREVGVPDFAIDRVPRIATAPKALNAPHGGRPGRRESTMTEDRTQHAKRRRPTQSRSRATAEAIQQAFVQLLTEKSYARVSIREVTHLAGVGIGSFYEYFATKDALAAVCIRQRVRAVATAMGQSIEATRHLVLPERADALMLAQCGAPLAEPQLWAALFLVERQVSGIEAFKSLYDDFVGLWARALGASPEMPPEAVLEAAFAAHAIVYGLVSQTLITRSVQPDAAAVRQLLRTAVHG